MDANMMAVDPPMPPTAPENTIPGTSTTLPSGRSLYDLLAGWLSKMSLKPTPPSNLPATTPPSKNLRAKHAKQNRPNKTACVDPLLLK
ncbi:hypothetical protein FOMPIDRAFT_92791 [Fomitopsis schrenkii]|uniref:Uncharacterized protein n=1 Tax=Fomitopsis schrenkii TaxID=2126942 RepID=S8DPQ6_FOMSC|nr:hypothetical protein FOMPIDRAFT_92791 [Fomitopsis schrenkii]